MSDHFSGPAIIGDPAADITDFYAFPSPERAGSLVLIMDVFPMAPPQALFSDALTYRFRLRPLVPSDKSTAPGPEEYTIEIRFSDVPEGSPVQKAKVVTSDGREADFVVGEGVERNAVRAFAGLVSDPFFMDVEAAIRTTMSGKLSFANPGTNTAQFRDCLTIVVEIPFASILKQFNGRTLIGAVAETVVTRPGKPIRMERVGRPEIKNFVLANTARDPRTRGLELRDLYNREDAFGLSAEYRPLYESRLDTELAFFDTLDGQTAWPAGPDGHHPLRDFLVNDYLVVDLAYPFAPGTFLQIERAMLDGEPHSSAGGRWLDDDILDEMLTLYVNGSRGPRFGDGVHAPTKPARIIFPYLREPNKRTDLALPAFLGGG